MAAPHYLLDTNIISDLIRYPQGVIRDRIQAVGESEICTSIVVAAELRFGALKKDSNALSQRVETILSHMPILALEPEADRTYAQIRLHLEQAGCPIGPNDLLIAAQTKELGLTLVTANEREFKRVPGLAIENWL